jgi:hypothetical protein
MGLVVGGMSEQSEKCFHCTFRVRTRKWTSEKGSQTLPNRISALV